MFNEWYELLGVGLPRWVPPRRGVRRIAGVIPHQRWEGVRVAWFYTVEAVVAHRCVRSADYVKDEGAI